VAEYVQIVVGFVYVLVQIEPDLMARSNAVYILRLPELMSGLRHYQFIDAPA
jgi:hypothetical protein